jgi:hypothetical protein
MLEKLMSPHLVNKCTAFYENRRLIMAFKRALTVPSLNQINPVYEPPSHFLNIHFITTLASRPVS